MAWLRRGPLTTIWNTCLLGHLEGFNGFCKWTIIVGHKGLLKLASSLLNLASPRWLHAKRAQLCGPTHRGTGETPAEERESESQSESQIQIQAGWFGLFWIDLDAFQFPYERMDLSPYTTRKVKLLAQDPHTTLGLREWDFPAPVPWETSWLLIPVPHIFQTIQTSKKQFKDVQKGI